MRHSALANCLHGKSCHSPLQDRQKLPFTHLRSFFAAMSKLLESGPESDFGTFNFVGDLGCINLRVELVEHALFFFGGPGLAGFGGPSCFFTLDRLTRSSPSRARHRARRYRHSGKASQMDSVRP